MDSPFRSRIRSLAEALHLHQGLVPTRTFSSRLSMDLTILVATLSVPGWIAHTLAPRAWRTARATTPGVRT